MRAFCAFLITLCALLLPAADDAKKDPNLGVILDPTACEVWTTPSGAKYHRKDCAYAKEKATLADELTASATACSKCSPPIYDPRLIAVFTGGEAGKKYHLFSCRFAKEQTTLAKVVADGLTPCSTCKAPALWTPPASASAAVSASATAAGKK